MRLAFALPEQADLPSGGNLYNAALLGELEALGVAVTRIASPREIARTTGSLVVVDSLRLDELDAFRHHLAARRLAFLAHHLPSLEPGLGPGRREEARAREAALLGGCDLLWATSEFCADYLRGLVGKAAPILVVTPAVGDLTVQGPAQGKSVEALLVGHLIPRKGVLDLLAALRDRLRGAEVFRLRVVGREDLDTRYAEACRRCLADCPELGRRVDLVGSQRPERMFAHYGEANLLVSASRMETFGMAVYEALCMGRFVLAQDGGHVASLLDSPRRGRVFASTEALADAFFDLARSPRKLARCSQSAYDHRIREPRSWRRAAEELVAGLAAFGFAEGAPSIRR